MDHSPIVLQNKDFTELTEKQLRSFAPVLFNDTPRNWMSASYMPVMTWDIIKELRSHGYVPTHVQLRRRAGMMDTTAHTVRFSQVNERRALVKRGDVAPQLYMRNSLDGSHKLEFWNGLMRMVCSNGLIVSDASIAQPLAVRHLAAPTLAAIMAIQEIAAQSSVMFQHIDAMRKQLLTERQQLNMATGAVQMMNITSVIRPVELLAARRPDDAGADVWRTFNRIQENVIRGGIAGRTASNRPTKTRGLTGIEAQLNANTALWHLAMQAIGRAADSSRSAVRTLKEFNKLDTVSEAREV